MPEDSGQSEGGESNGGLMTGNRGWIIVLAVVILEAAFFIVLLKFRTDKTPASSEVGGAMASANPADFMKRVVTLDKLAYSIPQPGGQPMTLAMDLVIVLGLSDPEIRDNVTLTEQDWGEFKQAVAQMVPWIKDQLNRTINKMTSSELSTEAGQEQIREIVRDKINTKLRSLDFKLSNPDISKKRVTEVLITNIYFN